MATSGQPFRIGRLALVFRWWGYMLYFAGASALVTLAANNGGVGVALGIGIALVCFVIGRRLTTTHLTVSETGVEVRNVWTTARIEAHRLRGATLHLPLVSRWSFRSVSTAVLVLPDRSRTRITAVSAPASLLDSPDALDQLAQLMAMLGCKIDRSHPFPR